MQTAVTIVLPILIIWLYIKMSKTQVFDDTSSFEERIEKINQEEKEHIKELGKKHLKPAPAQGTFIGEPMGKDSYQQAVNSAKRYFDDQREEVRKEFTKGGGLLGWIVLIFPALFMGIIYLVFCYTFNKMILPRAAGACLTTNDPVLCWFWAKIIITVMKAGFIGGTAIIPSFWNPIFGIAAIIGMIITELLIMPMIP